MRALAAIRAAVCPPLVRNLKEHHTKAIHIHKQVPAFPVV